MAIVLQPTHRSGALSSTNPVVVLPKPTRQAQGTRELKTLSLHNQNTSEANVLVTIVDMASSPEQSQNLFQIPLAAKGDSESNVLIETPIECAPGEQLTVALTSLMSENVTFHCVWKDKKAGE